MKKTINLLLVLLLVAVISNAQDNKAVITSGNVENKTTAPGDAVIFDQVEEMPHFNGGNDALVKFLTDNIKYPESSKANKEQGTVFVQFVVEAGGKVINPKVLKGVNADLDGEALRVISMMPAWIPGKKGGENVNVAMTLPVKFTL